MHETLHSHENVSIQSFLKFMKLSLEKPEICSKLSWNFSGFAREGAPTVMSCRVAVLQLVPPVAPGHRACTGWAAPPIWWILWWLGTILRLISSRVNLEFINGAMVRTDTHCHMLFREYFSPFKGFPLQVHLYYGSCKKLLQLLNSASVLARANLVNNIE